MPGNKHLHFRSNSMRPVVLLSLLHLGLVFGQFSMEFKAVVVSSTSWTPKVVKNEIQ